MNKETLSTIGKTAGFGILTLATMLISSIISDKFVSNGTKVIEDVQAKVAQNQLKKNNL